MERLPGATRARASCLFLGRVWVLFLAVGLALLGLVEPEDQLLADRVRLQDDVEALAIFVRKRRTDVEPVVVLLGTLDDGVDPVHLVGLLGHDAPSFRCQSATCSVASGTPREHEQAAAHEFSRGRRLVSELDG
jgi:hypothetical protein